MPGDVSASPMKGNLPKDSDLGLKTTKILPIAGASSQEASKFESDDPATPVHVWPDTDEEWNDEYYHQLCKPLNPFCGETQASLQKKGPAQDCRAGSSCFLHLAVPLPSSSPQGTAWQVSEMPLVQLLGKESITPMSQSTTLDFSTTPSIDSESDCESLTKTEKLKKEEMAKSKQIYQPLAAKVEPKPPLESPLKQAMRTGELALKKARALVPVDPDPDQSTPSQPKPSKPSKASKCTKRSGRRNSRSDSDFLPTGQVHR